MMQWPRRSAGCCNSHGSGNASWHAGAGTQAGGGEIMVDVNPTEAGFDPEDFTGFTRDHLRAFSRFRSVAIDNHLQNGNLDGSGENPDVKHHIKGIVDTNTLLNQYELPVVMSVPTEVSSQPRTTASDDTTFGFAVSAWVSDYDQAYGLEMAQVIIGQIVNNVESNRTLESSPGAGDPIAVDAGLAGLNSVNYGFELNVDSQFTLKYGTAEFEVQIKRERTQHFG